mmetsp:Transcript_4652/g.14056  ORF Transcript_4652/g.14056 Transcript_4652/m.14056 type:complete len:229 (+) Transcript_4652:1137-1823(+)
MLPFVLGQWLAVEVADTKRCQSPDDVRNWCIMPRNERPLLVLYKQVGSQVRQASFRLLQNHLADVQRHLQLYTEEVVKVFLQPVDITAGASSREQNHVGVSNIPQIAGHSPVLTRVTLDDGRPGEFAEFCPQITDVEVQLVEINIGEHRGKRICTRHIIQCLRFILKFDMACAKGICHKLFKLDVPCPLSQLLEQYICIHLLEVPLQVYREKVCSTPCLTEGLNCCVT